MKSNREIAIKECLKWEGGYSNDMADPGGPTNWGITLADARKYWKTDATAADVRNMPQSSAVDIYRQKYWINPQFNCDNLPSGLDLAMFDFGVNSGPARASKYLALCKGPTTVDKINQLCDQRLYFLQRLKTWPNFGKGWGRRVAGIKAKAIEMAKAEPTSTAPVVAGTGTATAAAGGIYYYWNEVSTFVISHRISLALTAGALILVGAGIAYLRNRKQ